MSNLPVQQDHATSTFYIVGLAGDAKRVPNLEIVDGPIEWRVDQEGRRTIVIRRSQVRPPVDGFYGGYKGGSFDVERTDIKRGVISDWRAWNGQRAVARVCPAEVLVETLAVDERIEALHEQIKTLLAEKQAILDAAIAGAERVKAPPFDGSTAGKVETHKIRMG